MDPSTYVRLAVQTESTPQLHRELPSKDGVTAKLDGLTPQESRIAHAALGLSTEAGELLDVIKKRLFYGKPMDMTNVVEELGDHLWYIAVAVDAIGVSFEDLFEQNIAKLQSRYPAGTFTEKHAITRSLDRERAILEELLRRREVEFAAQGGRGVELAEEIDEIRRELAAHGVPNDTEDEG